jgi:hypothetical protein
MKGVLVAVVAVALLAGCAGGAHPTVTPSPRSATFTSRALGFSVAYDASAFVASVNWAYTGHDRESRWPGIGTVRADQLLLLVALKEPASLLRPLRGEVQVTALKPAHALHPPTLAAFRTETNMRWARSNGWLTGLPRAVTFDGLPAFRYDGQFHNAETPATTSVVYTVFHGGFIYVVRLEAPTKRWPSVAARLNAVAQTFTVTK